MLGLNQIKNLYINNKFNNPIPHLSIEQNKIVIINYTLLNRYGYMMIFIWSKSNLLPHLYKIFN